MSKLLKKCSQVSNTCNLILQLKYHKTEEERNDDDDEMSYLETVRVLEGVALQHGFVGR